VRKFGYFWSFENRKCLCGKELKFFRISAFGGWAPAHLVVFWEQETGEQETDRNGQWQHIATALDNEISLTEEPTGIHLEYRVNAINKAGQSEASNTIAVVL